MLDTSFPATPNKSENKSFSVMSRNTGVKLAPIEGTRISLEVQSHRRGKSEMGQYKSPHRKEKLIEVSEMVKTNP